MSEKYTGKAGIGGSNDHEYVYDWEKHRVKPTESGRAKVESCLFYGLCFGAIVIMVIFVLGH